MQSNFLGKTCNAINTMNFMLFSPESLLVVGTELFAAAPIVVGGVTATCPDIDPAIERMRPYIGIWWRKGALPFGGAAPG